MVKCVSEDCNYFKTHGKCSSACENQGFTKIFTNYDRIKNMNVDEMAELLTIETWCQTCVLGENDCPMFEMSTKTCKENIKKWLESEVG